MNPVAVRKKKVSYVTTLLSILRNIKTVEATPESLKAAAEIEDGLQQLLEQPVEVERSRAKAA